MNFVVRNMEECMRDWNPGCQQMEALELYILQFLEVPPQPIIQLVPSPVYDVVNCRVQTNSRKALNTLSSYFHGIRVGESVYFSIPTRHLDLS